jgi:hypothetical protein
MILEPDFYIVFKIGLDQDTSNPDHFFILRT